MEHETNGQIIKRTAKSFWNKYIPGGTILVIGVFTAVIFILIADLFEKDGLWNRVALKFAEGAMFVGSAGLIGIIFTYINSYRNGGNGISTDSQYITSDGTVLNKKIIYEIGE